MSSRVRALNGPSTPPLLQADVQTPPFRLLKAPEQRRSPSGDSTPSATHVVLSREKALWGNYGEG